MSEQAVRELSEIDGATVVEGLYVPGGLWFAASTHDILPELSANHRLPHKDGPRGIDPREWQDSFSVRFSRITIALLRCTRVFCMSRTRARTRRSSGSENFDPLDLPARVRHQARKALMPCSPAFDRLRWQVPKQACDLPKRLFRRSSRHHLVSLSPPNNFWPRRSVCFGKRIRRDDV